MIFWMTWLNFEFLDMHDYSPVGEKGTQKIYATHIEQSSNELGPDGKQTSRPNSFLVMNKKSMALGLKFFLNIFY